LTFQFRFLGFCHTGHLSPAFSTAVAHTRRQFSSLPCPREGHTRLMSTERVAPDEDVVSALLSFNRDTSQVKPEASPQLAPTQRSVPPPAALAVNTPMDLGRSIAAPAVPASSTISPEPDDFESQAAANRRKLRGSYNCSVCGLPKVAPRLPPGSHMCIL
jgi:hypothetical protein